MFSVELFVSWLYEPIVKVPESLNIEFLDFLMKNKDVYNCLSLVYENVLTFYESNDKLVSGQLAKHILETNNVKHIGVIKNYITNLKIDQIELDLILLLKASEIQKELVDFEGYVSIMDSVNAVIDRSNETILHLNKKLKEKTEFQNVDSGRLIGILKSRIYKETGLKVNGALLRLVISGLKIVKINKLGLNQLDELETSIEEIGKAFDVIIPEIDQ